MLRDCSEKITREHYVSDGLLRLLETDEGLTVGGLSWQGADPQIVGRKSLAAKVLCDRHNTALSSLDGAALRFFEAIRAVDDSAVEAPPVLLVNGHDLERWLLKLLCGAVFSGNAARTDGTPFTGWEAPKTWIRILFGKEQFPKGCGIYFRGLPGEQYVEKPGFEFAVISNDELGVYGAIIRIDRGRFLFAMSPPASRATDLLANATYRPTELVFVRGSDSRTVLFGWSMRGDDRGLTMTVATREANSRASRSGIGSQGGGEMFDKKFIDLPDHVSRGQLAMPSYLTWEADYGARRVPELVEGVLDLVRVYEPMREDASAISTEALSAFSRRFAEIHKDVWAFLKSSAAVEENLAVMLPAMYETDARLQEQRSDAHPFTGIDPMHLVATPSYLLGREVAVGWPVGIGYLTATAEKALQWPHPPGRLDRRTWGTLLGFNLLLAQQLYPAVGDYETAVGAGATYIVNQRALLLGYHLGRQPITP